MQAKALELFPHQALRVLDLGCGSGILSVMLALQRPQWQISAIDIQAPLVDLAQHNSRAQGLSIGCQCADLRSFESEDMYDLIISNPPWLKTGTGHSSADYSKEISRREVLCDMNDVLACIQRNLKKGGSALLLYPDSRLNELKKTCAHYLLDIIQGFPSADTNKYLIYHIMFKE